jgi:hypothetical protein
MQILVEGQTIRHELYGNGTIVECDNERTTVDFDEHGTRKFVTSIWNAELIGEILSKPTRRRARRSKKAPKAVAAAAAK